MCIRKQLNINNIKNVKKNAFICGPLLESNVSLQKKKYQTNVMFCVTSHLYGR